MMATTNHTTLLDFINVFEGQNTKNNGQRGRQNRKKNCRIVEINDYYT